MIIDRATPADIRCVAERMRDRDAEEFLALLPFDSREVLTEYCVQKFSAFPEPLVARYRGAPVAIGATPCLRPNVASLGMFATEEFQAVGLALTRWLKTEHLPALRAAGVHRVEALSLAQSTHIHKWLLALGLRREVVLQGYGKNREDFIQFAQVIDARQTSP